MASPLLHHLHLQMDEIHNFLQMEREVLVLWKRALIRETGMFRNHATDCCPGVTHVSIPQGFNGDPTAFMRRPCVRKLDIMRTHFRTHVLSHEHAETLLDALFTRDHLVDLAVEDAEDVRAQRRCLILVAQHGMQQWISMADTIEHLTDMVRFLFAVEEPHIHSAPYPQPQLQVDSQHLYQEAQLQNTPLSDTGHRMHIVPSEPQQQSQSGAQNRKSLVRSPLGQRATTTTTKGNGTGMPVTSPPKQHSQQQQRSGLSGGSLYAPRPTRAVHIPQPISV